MLEELDKIAQQVKDALAAHIEEARYLRTLAPEDDEEDEKLEAQ